jgi:hypothetical protein
MMSGALKLAQGSLTPAAISNFRNADNDLSLFWREIT